MIPNFPKSVNVYFSFPVALLARYKWVDTMKAIHDPALEGSRQCQLHDHYWPSVTPSNIIERAVCEAKARLHCNQASLSFQGQDPCITSISPYWKLNLYLKLNIAIHFCVNSNLIIIIVYLFNRKFQLCIRIANLFAKSLYYFVVYNYKL